MTFDPTHDKLHDQPVTIGGDKSAAAGHPNSGPEVPHADLDEARALLRDTHPAMPVVLTPEQGRAVFAALGDTVPREQYERAGDAAAVSEYAAQKAERERDEARAERDALAHVVEQVKGDMHWTAMTADPNDPGAYVLGAGAERAIFDTDPAVSLALHDAGVWDACLDAIEENELNTEQARKGNPYRADAIREEPTS